MIAKCSGYRDLNGRVVECHKPPFEVPGGGGEGVTDRTCQDCFSEMLKVIGELNLRRANKHE